MSRGIPWSGGNVTGTLNLAEHAVVGQHELEKESGCSLCMAALDHLASGHYGDGPPRARAGHRTRCRSLVTARNSLRRSAELNGGLDRAPQIAHVPARRQAKEGGQEGGRRFYDCHYTILCRSELYYVM